jgi:hypothetical protein
MKNKTSKAYNQQANKNDQMQKRTREIELLTSTTLHDAQPSRSLSPFAFHPQHFKVFTFHPSIKRNLILFQCYTIHTHNIGSNVATLVLISVSKNQI